MGRRSEPLDEFRVVFHAITCGDIFVEAKDVDEAKLVAFQRLHEVDWNDEPSDDIVSIQSVEKYTVGGNGEVTAERVFEV